MRLIQNFHLPPQLEFAVSAWNPYLLKDINVLEKVQARATKMAHEIKHLEYSKRCELLDLDSLINRRLRGDLIQQFKLVNNLESIRWHAQPIIRDPRGGHRSFLAKEIVKNCKQRFNFFTNRIVTPWNALPDYVLQAGSVNAFKSRLDEHQKNS